MVETSVSTTTTHASARAYARSNSISNPVFLNTTFDGKLRHVSHALLV